MGSIQNAARSIYGFVLAARAKHPSLRKKRDRHGPPASRRNQGERKPVVSCWFLVLSCFSWTKSWWHSRFPPFPQRTRKEWGTPRLYLIQVLGWNGQAARQEGQGTSCLYRDSDLSRPRVLVKSRALSQRTREGRATLYNLVGVVKRHVECPRWAGPSGRR